MVVTGLVLGSTACASMPGGAELDARMEAGWRPSKSACIFGGKTPSSISYCARVNFGADGIEAILGDLNDGILQSSPGHELACTKHVALAEAKLKAYTEYETVSLYSCDDNPPIENGRKVCHVSLLVTDKITGARFVMDNGHVLSAATESGVGPLHQFAQQVDLLWTGGPSTLLAMDAKMFLAAARE